MENDVPKIVQEYASRIRDDKIYFRPNIPSKKLKNVIKAYAPDILPEDVHMLIDNTVFGNAKDGAALTESKLYIHNTLENPLCIELNTIESIQLVKGVTSAKVYINGNKSLETATTSTDAMVLFVELLKEITKQPKTPGVETSETKKDVEEPVNIEPAESSIEPTESSTPQTCIICGDIFNGESVDWKKYTEKLSANSKYQLGFQCQNCGVSFCDKHKKELKWHLWSGYGKSICPRCNATIGPGKVILREGAPLLLTSYSPLGVKGPLIQKCPSCGNPTAPTETIEKRSTLGVVTAGLLLGALGAATVKAKKFNLYQCDGCGHKWEQELPDA